MHLNKLMDFLDQNISSEDRKIYNKLVAHIQKRHTKNLTALVSDYHIDKKKFLFPEQDKISDAYINKLESLITYCKKIIDNKINISKFDSNAFNVGRQLDISTVEKIDKILKHLYTYTQYYKEISISRELVKNPLMILTINTKKKVDSKPIEKHAYDFVNNHTLVQDKVVQLNNNQSNKKIDAILEPKMVKEAIDDYFNTSGEFYYLSSEEQEKLSSKVMASIDIKNKEEEKSSTSFFNLAEFLIPLGVIALLILCFAFSVVSQISLWIVVYIIVVYAIVNFGFLVNRLNKINENDRSFSAKFYSKRPKRFLIYKIMTGVIPTLCLVYLLIFNHLYTIFSDIDDFLWKFFDNQIATTIITTIVISLSFGILFLANKFYKRQLSIVCLVMSILYFLTIIFIRANIMSFIVFSGASIYFSVFAITLLVYLLLQHKLKVVYGVFIGLLLLDVVVMIALDNEFYFRIFTTSISWLN